MTPEQAIARLNSMAQASHRAYMAQLVPANSPERESLAAMLARYNALLDAIEIVRQIHAEETSHV